MRWCALNSNSIGRLCVLAASLTVSAAMSPALHAQSLVDPASFRGPAADPRAHRVGDLLTVLVLEATRARSQAATDSDRGADLGIALHSPSADYDATLDTHNRSKGAGETTRLGELSTQLTVRVTGVEPNGLLRIRGTQVLVVNREQQRIELSGVVRPDDISATNTVWSSRIGEADVAVLGKGTVTESQRRSLVSRVFQWLGLL